MKKPLSIPRPQLERAEKLSPLQLNDIKIDDKHTILTPELLIKISGNN